MPGADLSFSLQRFLSLLLPLLAFAGCSASQPPVRPKPAPVPKLYTPPATLALPEPNLPRVMLGIDVLEAEGFAAIKGKRIGLLTHPAGVNRRGISTIEILRHAPGVKLVALYGVEHGIYDEYPAEKTYPDHLDPRTGLMIYSLYNGRTREATAAQLRPIDALVVDLQDIGTRSYTFVSAMKLAMEACFKNGKEIIVLDRPNPLGGLKVDGPLLEPQLTSYVGSFPVPYVHGLTIGELARMAKDLRGPSPFALAVPDAVRERGRLLVIPMRGWTRSMRWRETGLTWIPTSPFVTDFGAIEGYPMVGLGTYSDPKSNFDIGFSHGIGKAYAFRGIYHHTAKIDVVEKYLRSFEIPGLQFQRVSGIDQQGKPAVGLYIEITDYDAWQPTAVNFYLMKLACRLDPRNPFLPAPRRDFRGFLRHMGSEEFLRALQREGASVDVTAWLRRWHEQDLIFQRQSERYWLYR